MSPFEDLLSNPHQLKLDDTAFTLSVVICTMCGCVVADKEIHAKFHLQHGHSGFGFDSEKEN